MNQANTFRHSITKHQQSAEISFASDLSTLDPVNAFSPDGLIGGYEDFTLMFEEPTLDFNFDDYMAFDVPTSNTKPDNYRQNSQHVLPEPGRLPCDQTGSNDCNVLDSPVTTNLSRYTPVVGAVDEISGLMFPHSSQMFDDPQSRRRCDLSHAHSQSDSVRSSNAKSNSHAASSNAGQLQTLEHTEPYSVSSNSADISARATQQPTHTAHLHAQQSPSASAHADGTSDGRSSRGGTGDGGDPLPLMTGDLEMPTNTALRRSRRPDVSVGRSAASATPQSNALRHRLRSAGVSDSALQSELSSTSATSSSSISRPENATALEGRPTGWRASASSARQSLRDTTTTSGRSAATSAPLSSPLLPRSSPLQGESAILLRSPVAASAASPQQTRGSSALLAHPSPFDRSSMQDRSSEMFRLKHRIPASLDEPTPAATQTRSAAASLSAQANGGSYPRPGSTNILATLQQTTARNSATTVSTTGSTTSVDKAPRMLFTESDTRRERDHHGRPTAAASLEASPGMVFTAASVAMAVLALGAMLLMTSSYVSSSLLPLAALLLTGNLSARLADARSTVHRAIVATSKGHQSMTAYTLGLQRLIGCV